MVNVGITSTVGKASSIKEMAPPTFPTFPWYIFNIKYPDKGAQRISVISPKPGIINDK